MFMELKFSVLNLSFFPPSTCSANRDKTVLGYFWWHLWTYSITHRGIQSPRTIKSRSIKNKMGMFEERLQHTVGFKHSFSHTDPWDEGGSQRTHTCGSVTKETVRQVGKVYRPRWVVRDRMVFSANGPGAIEFPSEKHEIRCILSSFMGQYHFCQIIR